MFYYVQIAESLKMLGNGRLEGMCFDGIKRLCHVRGKLRKRQWINTSGKSQILRQLNVRPD